MQVRVGGNVGIMKPLSIIVAVDEQGGFGKDGKIPWNYPEDLKHFKAITKGAACIMGKQTYLDMYDMTVARKNKGKNKSDKPVKIPNILPGRESYVVSSTMRDAEGATVVKGIREAVLKTKKDKIFILGGERLFIESLPWVKEVYMTLVKGAHNCDKFFPVEYVHKHFRIQGNAAKGTDSLLFIKYTRR